MRENQPGDNSAESENVIGLVWSKIFPYWPLYCLMLALSIMSAWFYLQKATPLYEASAAILIKDEKKGSDDSPIMESLNLLGTKKIVENEIEVLDSRSLIEEVVLNLKMYAPVFKQGKWRDSSAYSYSPIRIEAQEPGDIAEVPQIKFSFDSKRNSVLIGNTNYPLNFWVTTDYGILKFIPAKNKKLSQTGQLYFSLLNPKKVVLDLAKRLNAIPSSKLTTVIDLKLQDEDPLLAEEILNQLILSYNRAAVTDKNALAINMLSFVQERLDIVGKHLDSIEHKIEQYKSKKGAVDIGSQGKLFLENVSANDQKVGDINMQLAALDQVEKYVLSKDNNGIIAPSILDNSNSLLSSLLKKLYETELEKEKLRKTTGENSPTMIALNDQATKIKPSILENIQSQRKSLEASRTNLSSTSNSYSSLLQSIPQKERQLVDISRQQNIENNIYSFLLQKREEAALSNSSIIADNRLIDRAQSSLFPVSPNKKIIYLVAGVLGLSFSLLIVLSKEMFSQNILYRVEIEKLSIIPIIGEINLDKSKEFIVIDKSSGSLVAEQFRKLRTSLSNSIATVKTRKIMITSTGPGDGKSFITINLGICLALTDKKVIIIEADLKNPTLSNKLRLNHERGLSTYLSGHHDITEVIEPTDVNENLFLIPSGSLPHNPSELLINGRMEKLLAYLEKNYDYILLDTAPVVPISDAYVLTHLCDQTLYIIRHAHTPKIAVQRLDKVNKINELKNMTIVFNGVNIRGFGSAGYGYGYGYEDAYGYASNNKKKGN